MRELTLKQWNEGQDQERVNKLNLVRQKDPIFCHHSIHSTCLKKPETSLLIKQSPKNWKGEEHPKDIVCSLDIINKAFAKFFFCTVVGVFD